jgi:hypothetical protein
LLDFEDEGKKEIMHVDFVPLLSILQFGILVGNLVAIWWQNVK